VVYVISKDSKPLMPTKRHRKVRRLLKQGLAKVVRREPFTIQLLYDTTTYTQPVIAGMDTGSKTAGVSAITDKQKLFSIEVELRQDIKKLLLERREYRRNRRYGKTRFLNRKRRNNWLSPSLQWKVDAHNRLVNLITKILPIAKVEIAPFDIHKIVNPDVEGSQYQEGPQKGFFDVREYCLWRAGYKSELSGKKGIHRRFDKVRYKNQVGIIYSLSSGYFDIRTLNGEKIHSSAKYQDLTKMLMLERREQRTFLHLKKDAVSCAGL